MRHHRPLSGMRRLLVLVSAVLATAYGAGASYFFVQERWARTERLDFDETAARHPEAMLFAARMRLASNRYGEAERALLRRSILAAPSFYEGPYLLAAFRENRFDPAADVRRAYEAALARYPANGRLHLAFGRWLLDARSDLSAWRVEGEPGRLEDPLLLAERRLQSAMELEPELTWSALGNLESHRVPPDRWTPLVPEAPLARRHLVDALFQARRTELGWELLKEDPEIAEPSLLRRVVQRALDSGQTELAVAAAEHWLALESSGEAVGPDVLEPTVWLARAYLSLDEPERAYEIFTTALSRTDAGLGRESRASLELLCAAGDEYLKLQQAASAEAWFGEAASRAPSYVPALYGLARAARASGDLATAASYYEQVLRVDPEHARAREEHRTLLLELARR